MRTIILTCHRHVFALAATCALRAKHWRGCGLRRWRTMGYHCGIQTITFFLPIGQVLKILWHFEILTCESMGKRKMWNISKTVNCRAKRMKILESLGALCKIISDSTIFETLLLQQFSLDFIQTSDTKYHNQGLI